ncbi:MAG TPA: TIGR01244 family phosphatase [Oceanospirillaceae bacterium]|nr:TIGR01244 family phosphatase [Oceanospirillaceae bacterium]
MAITSVTNAFGVAPQLDEAEMAQVKALGYTAVINNRPDGEPGHPTDSASLQAAAEAQGLAYVHMPVFGMNFPSDTVAEMQSALAAHAKVLAFCRTGNRSINTWARAQADDVDVASLVAPTGFTIAE